MLRHVEDVALSPNSYLAHHPAGLVALRMETLCARGPDEPPDTSQARWTELWGTADAEATRRRLLSFASCSNLDERSRMGALAVTDTAARLELVLHGLRLRRAELAAEVALRGSSSQS